MSPVSTQRTPNRSTGPARLMMMSGLSLALLCASASAAASIDSPLAGPDVETEQAETTLIDRNIDGSMRRLDIPPAEAALEQMELSEGVRADIDEMLAARAAVIDGIVSKNLQQIQALRDGGEDGKPNRREQFRAIRELFAPVLEDGPLEKRVADLLPESRRAEYLGMIAEHREARGRQAMQRRMDERGIEAELLGDPMDEALLFDGEFEPLDAPPPPRGERRREQRGDADGERRAGRDGPRGNREMMAQLASLRHEVRRSVERVVGERQDHMQRLITGLDLTGEQEVQIRELFSSRRAEGQAEEPTRAERRELMRSLAEILTPEQRAKLRDMNGRAGRGERGDRPPRGERPGRRPIDD